MTFFFGSIAMSAFAIGWFLYRWLVKEDLQEHMDEFRTGAFVLGVWVVVWWLLLK